MLVPHLLWVLIFSVKLKLTISAAKRSKRDSDVNQDCPGIDLRWDLSLSQMRMLLEKMEVRSREMTDHIAGLRDDTMTRQNSVRYMNEFDRIYGTERNIIVFPDQVSVESAVRNFSTKMDKKLSEFEVDIAMRKDFFDALIRIENKLGSQMTPEELRYIKKNIKYGRRLGLHLPLETRNQIKDILKKTSQLEIEFSKNLNDDNTQLEFKTSDLEGLSPQLLKSLSDGQSPGTKKITMDETIVNRALMFIEKAETRKKVYMAYNSRCKDTNTAILESILLLRHRTATLLGYPNFASYVLEMNMARSPDRVAQFLNKLQSRFESTGREERRKLLDYKRRDYADRKLEFDGKLHSWDVPYYMSRMEQKRFSFDIKKLKDYFPINSVIKGMFAIYQKLLTLKFEKMSSCQVWHPDVTLYSVRDGNTSTLLGYFYLDLFPRKGKFAHAASFGLQTGAEKMDGGRQVAVSAMVSNFNKPTETEPSLLPHDEVVTFFHEFGHIMHQMCTRTSFSEFGGLSVERDFVEAPSQMLENWCWEAEPLHMMGRHYKTNEPISEELLGALLKSREVNSALATLSQVLLAKYDQNIHTRGHVDTAKTFREMSEEILGIPAEEGTNMAASFGHLVGGYAAQYYGYMWSEVYSADMYYSRFKKEGILNPSVGADYRNSILRPGGSKDAGAMLRDFLGREPESEAFTKRALRSLRYIRSMNEGFN